MTQRQDMLDTFASVHHQFREARQRLGQQEAKLQGALGELEERLGSAAQGQSTPFGQQHPVSRYFQQWQQQSVGVCQAWRERIERYQGATSFREKVGDSFLLYIYGKVNAGKSSLGNFVALGTASPDKASAEGQGVRFGWQASADGKTNEGRLGQGFGVDRQECTRDIQYFTLPGLTWVDSPGLHSNNGENGRLAKRYAEAADMVVYLMSSEHPARASDAEELRYLMQLGKPLYVVISCSDEKDWYKNEQGAYVERAAMKPPALRREQQEYTRKVLREVAIEAGRPEAAEACHIISLSTACAENASSAGEWQDSGMAEFLSSMADMAQNDSVTHKRQAPLKQWEAFCRDVMASADHLEASQKRLQESLDKLDTDIGATAQRLQRNLRMQLETIASELPDSLFEDRAALVRKVRERLAPLTSQALERELALQLDEFQASAAKALDFSSAEHLPGFEEKYRELRQPGRDWSREMGALAGAAGAAIGFKLAGTRGSAMGMAVGSKVGEWLGSLISSDGDVTRIPAGNNRDEIELALVRLLGQDLERHIESVYSAPLRDGVDGIRPGLAASREALSHLIHQLRQAL